MCFKCVSCDLHVSNMCFEYVSHVLQMCFTCDSHVFHMSRGELLLDPLRKIQYSFELLLGMASKLLAMASFHESFCEFTQVPFAELVSVWGLCRCKSSSLQLVSARCLPSHLPITCSAAPIASNCMTSLPN